MFGLFVEEEVSRDLGLTPAPGAPPGGLPLLSVEIAGDVVDRDASLQLTQVFVNPSASPASGTYHFSLADGVALFSCEACIEAPGAEPRTVSTRLESSFGAPPNLKGGGGDRKAHS